MAGDAINRIKGHTSESGVLTDQEYGFHEIVVGIPGQSCSWEAMISPVAGARDKPHSLSAAPPQPGHMGGKMWRVRASKEHVILNQIPTDQALGWDQNIPQPFQPN